MNKFYSYINSAIYNIRHNKAYAAFCIFGTALTFIFISIVLQLTNEVVNNTPPFVNADKEIHIGTSLKNEKGHWIGGVHPKDVPLFLSNVKEHQLCALHDTQIGNIFIDDGLVNGVVTFVNGDYWKINEFDFIAGRSFTEDEVTSKKPVVILRKSFVESNFKTDEILGQKVFFQNITYTVIGVVDDYSSFIGGNDKVWVPSTFNIFLPDATPYFDLYILPKEGITIDDFKDKVVTALKFYYNNRAIDIDIASNDILTRQEERIKSLGDNKLSYGIPIILLVLLLIPAINIVVISIANINNRAKEIAIRRSMGATILSSFVLIMIENLLLVMIGAIIGVALATPIASLISSSFLSGGMEGDVSLITNINFSILIFGVLPLSLLFTLFSGGIPAYLVAKGKISKILKGDFNKNGNNIKRSLGICIEQTLVFIILMLCIVSISIAVNKYNEPGLLDTEGVINFGYTSNLPNYSNELNEVSRNMDVLLENLKKSSNVEAMSETWTFVPYCRTDETSLSYHSNSDSITIDKTKLKVLIKASDKYGISVFALELIEGNWITDSKLADGSWPVVITKEIAEALELNKSVGKKFSVLGNNVTVVGVLAGFKNSVFTQSAPTVIIPTACIKMNVYRDVSAKVNDKDIFATDFFKEWNKLMTHESVSPLFLEVNSAKNDSMSEVVTDIVLQAIPTLFLLIFAFIGTFGIFWLTSQKRIKEFALRMAIGSTPKGLTCLVIKESIIITTLAMIPGLLLSIFIYEFTTIHVIAIGITVILMLMFSIFSAWYPAYIVSKINPAKAIKYE